METFTTIFIKKVCSPSIFTYVPLLYVLRILGVVVSRVSKRSTRHDFQNKAFRNYSLEKITNESLIERNLRNLELF